jgi:hypothetical protein
LRDVHVGNLALLQLVVPAGLLAVFLRLAILRLEDGDLPIDIGQLHLVLIERLKPGVHIPPLLFRRGVLLRLLENGGSFHPNLLASQQNRRSLSPRRRPAEPSRREGAKKGAATRRFEAH